jgi:F0F1-type ATP synthase assembly protein I
MSEPEPDEQPKDLPGALAFVGMGGTIAGSVGFGVAVGLWFDSHWGITPWGLVIGVVLGSCGAAAAVAAQVRRYL